MKTPALFSACMVLCATGASHAGLVSHQSLDSGSGLTLDGTPASGSNTASITTGGGGRFGEAVSLDGASDFVTVDAGNPITSNAARTVAAWVEIPTSVPTSGLQSVLAFGGAGNGAKFDLDLDYANGGVEIGIGNGRTVDTGLTFTSGWHLVVGVVPTNGAVATTLRTYYDGSVRSNTAAATVTQTVSASSNVYRIGTSANSTGTSPSAQFLNGKVDDISVWDEVLSADEIKGLFGVASLNYTGLNFDDLKTVHDNGSGFVDIGSTRWTYTTGLGSTAGLVNSTTLVLDSSAGTGLTGAPVPEPGAVAILAGVTGLLLRRHRRQKSR